MQLQSSAPPEPSDHDDGSLRRMLDQRRVMLTGAIDGKLAERICAQLLVLEADDPDRPITLYLHSPGGEVDAGFAIYDTMQALQCDVATVCLGLRGVDGAVPAVRGRARSARRARAQPHPDAPTARRGRGLRGRRRDPGRAVLARPRGSWPSSPRSTPARPSSGSSPTATATAGSPPRKPLDVRHDRRSDRRPALT